MRTSWHLFLRDLKRLLKNRRVYAIVLGVLITPSLYAWFNINAFWDPYSATENIRVAVVSEDTGAPAPAGAGGSPGETINIGKTLTDKLADNDKMGWEFPDADTAHEGLMKGDYFAEIRVPADFSEKLTHLVDGDYAHPTLDYYVNEKVNGIAPSITDKGASTIGTTITDTFKQQVAEAAAEQLRDTGMDVRGKVDSARDKASGSLGEVADKLDGASATAQDYRGRVDAARPALASTAETTDSIDGVLADLEGTLGEVDELTHTLQGTVAEFSGASSTALIESTNALKTGAARADASLTETTDQLRSTQRRAQVAADDVDGIVTQGEDTVSQLEGLAGAVPLPPEAQRDVDEVVGALHERTDASRAVLDGLREVDRTTSQTLDSVAGLGGKLSAAADQASDSARAASDNIAANAPAVSAKLADLSGSVSKVQAAVGSQRALHGQTKDLFAGIDKQLQSTVAILDQVSGDLHSYAGSARDTEADIAALLTTGDNPVLNDIVALQPDNVGDYLSSPVTITQHAVYPTENYGSAMASLFTNLSLWIGAFMLTIIYRVEADSAGFRRVTVGRGYLGRFFLFALMATLQAVVVITGNLAFGVQHASVPGMYATAIFNSMCYTAIVYALVAALGHVGRGLAIFLLMVQIPGASGLYPIELMPDFFRAVYPVLPFRFGIDAMRETVVGFYGHHYLRDVFSLGLLAAVVFAGGWLFRLALSHFHLMFNSQLARSGLIRSENVEITGSPYRLSDIMAAIGDRTEYRTEVDRRSRFIRDNYRALITAGIFFGVLGILVITGLAAFAHTDKTIMLALAVVWLLVVIVFLTVVEYLKQSAIDARAVSRLDDAELRDAIVHRHDSQAPASEVE